MINETDNSYGKPNEQELGDQEKEFLTPDSKILNSNTSIPIDVPFDKNLHEFYSGDSFTQPIAPKINEPTFGARVKRAAAEANDFAIGYNSIYSQFGLNTPIDDPRPLNYKVGNEDLSQIQKKNMGYVLDASGPRDFQRRRDYIIQQQQEDQTYDTGGWLTKATSGLIGGALGGIVSPSTWIPIANTVKYAKLSENVLMNLAKITPGFAAGAGAHNAWEQTQKAGGNLEDFAVNTYRDTLFSLAFMGGGLGIGSAFRGIKLWNVRNALNVMHKGIELQPVIAEDGSVKGIKAISTPGMNVSAAEVDQAQKFADSKMAQEGLFKIPVIGGYLGKGAAKLNPTLRMLNSPFDTVRGYFDRLGSHGLQTEANVKGVESPDKFEDNMIFLRGENTNLLTEMKALHYQRNDINTQSNVVGATKMQLDKWQNDEHVNQEQFHDEIINSMINDEPHKHSAVNQAVSLLREHMDYIYKNFREAYNLPEDWLSPATAKQYLTRVYDVQNMKLNTGAWNNMWVEWLTKSDQTIKKYMDPINAQREYIKQYKIEHEKLINNPAVSIEDKNESLKELKAIRKRLTIMKENVQNRIRSDADLRIHVKDWNALSADEAKKLKKILKPLKLKKDMLDEQKSIVSGIKKSILFNSENPKKVKEVKQFRKDLVVEEAKLDQITREHDTIEEKLQEDAYNGVIDKRYYDRIPESQRVKFKDPKDRLSFRDVYESEHQMRADAEAYHSTITNQTAEHTIGQIMGKLVGKTAGTPTLQRTLMIPDKILYQNGFLNKNIVSNVINYKNFLGRRTFLKNAFHDITIEGGIEPILERLTKEFKIKNAALQTTPTDKDGKPIVSSEKETKKKNKQIFKLDKQFTQAKEDIKNSYDKAMGNTRGSVKMQKYARITRAFAAMTKLGAVPLTMVTDLMHIVFKHGFWSFIKDGLLPELTTINGLLKTDKGDIIRANAAHAHLALSHVESGLGDRNWAGSAAQEYEPVSSSLSSGIEKAAHISGNIYGTNYIENFLQRVTANIVQSKIMKAMLDHEAGTLSKLDKEKLLIYGLNPEKHAESFLKGWRDAGSDGNGFGGYQSRYWEWEDSAASDKMAKTISKATRDTIFRRGMFDAPFALDDPFISMIFTFKGFIFGSMNRLLIPLMQRPDAEKLLGTMMMMAAGSLVSPLRHIVKGEDPIQPDESMFLNSLRDSNVFSSIMDPIDEINLMSGNKLLSGMQNDKYRNRTLAGLAGPIAGMGEDLRRFIVSTTTGNANQTDINRGLRLVPGLQAWYLRALSNKLGEATGLPKTMADAQRQNNS